MSWPRTISNRRALVQRRNEIECCAPRRVRDLLEQLRVEFIGLRLDHGPSQKEFGRKVGVSQMWVRMIEDNALAGPELDVVLRQTDTILGTCLAEKYREACGYVATNNP